MFPSDWPRPTGWRPLQLELLIDDAPVGTFAADRFRDDLRRAGKGDGRHAFETPGAEIGGCSAEPTWELAATRPDRPPTPTSAARPPHSSSAADLDLGLGLRHASIKWLVRAPAMAIISMQHQYIVVACSIPLLLDMESEVV